MKFYMDLLEDHTYNIYRLSFTPGECKAGSIVLLDHKGRPLVPPEQVSLELDRDGSSRVRIQRAGQIQTMRVVRYTIEDHSDARNRGTLPDPHAASTS